MSDVLTLKLTTGNPDILMSIKNKNGAVAKKVVGVDDLTSTLANSYQFSTGILPRGTRFFTGTPSKYLVGVETPSMVKVCVVYDYAKNESEKYNLPLPPCLFVFRVKDRKVISTSVHALKRPIFGEMDPLYTFPYGNTNCSSGRVCWGDVKPQKVESPLAITMLVSQFLDSTYNGDLFESNTVDFDFLDLPHRGFRSLVKALKDVEKFPPEALSATGKTILNEMRR